MATMLAVIRCGSTSVVTILQVVGGGVRKCHLLACGILMRVTCLCDVNGPVDAGEEQGDKQEHVNQAVHGDYVSRLSTDTLVCMSRSRRLS